MSTNLAAVTPRLSNEWYDRLKFIAQILLPALGALYFALGNIWHWANIEEVVGSIMAVDAFLGILLGINSSVYNSEPTPTDGKILVNDTGDGLVLKFLPTKNPSAMVAQSMLTFEVVHSTSTPEENA